jgi:hypothetical protein
MAGKPSDPSRRDEIARSRRHVVRALTVAVVAFVAMFAFLRFTRPLRLAHHPEWVLRRCSEVAVATFVLALVAARLRDAGR